MREGTGHPPRPRNASDVLSCVGRRHHYCTAITGNQVAPRSSRPPAEEGRTMTPTRRTTVVGAFEDRRQAERAVQDLCQAGFARDRIGFAARGPAGGKVED